MKRNILIALAAFLVCGLTVTLLTQCKKDKSSNNPVIVNHPEVTMRYFVSVSPDVLNVADIEINYIDETGAKKKEILTDTVWNKPFISNALPLTEGIWAKITPKTFIAEGDYQLSVQTSASYIARLTDGTETYEAWGNSFNDVTTAHDADQIATWCAKSPTIAIVVDEQGDARPTIVDFGGNSGSGGGGLLACELFCWIWDLDPAVYCAK